MSDHSPAIARVEFADYKAFAHLALRLHHMNILVGPNNCGKSTILDAFRTLDAGMRRARSRPPMRVPGPDGSTLGYRLSTDDLPMSVENVHTDYLDIPSSVAFTCTNDAKLILFFPLDGGAYLIAESKDQQILTTADFNRTFPQRISVVPVLGPLEHEEKVLTRDTVRRGLATHRASRHFRNYWRYYPDGFDDFSGLIRRTWPGMDIERPELADPGNKILGMYCLENRMTRELYWAGFGFQVWCQLLTHIARCSRDSILVVDEPEIYLHPDVQRQLLAILRDAGPDVVLATHSSEMMGEADPSEILLVDKTKRSCQRLRDIDSVQAALTAIGSIQNITLTQLARNRRVLFVEGLDDFRILRRFARRMGLSELATGVHFTPVESGGFANWDRVRSLGWGMEKTIGKSLRLGAVFDRDFWPDEQIASIEEQLRSHLHLAAIHRRKEIENYLLVPSVLQRALERAVRERAARRGEPEPRVWRADEVLNDITDAQRSKLQGQYIAKRVEFLRSDRRDDADIVTETIEIFSSRWSDVATRMELVSGKDVLAAFRQRAQSDFSVTLTDNKIIDAFSADDIPDDLKALLRSLEHLRTTQPGS